MATIAPANLQIGPRASAIAKVTGKISQPMLWGPPPHQRPNRYIVVTAVSQGSAVVAGTPWTGNAGSCFYLG